MTELKALQGNTKSRLEFEFNELLKEGATLTLGFKKELSRNNLIDMQIQLDVLSLDSSKDADGYTIVDTDGVLHTGISKANFEASMFELKVGAMALWQQKALLMDQIPNCTTEAEFDALVFE